MCDSCPISVSPKQLNEFYKSLYPDSTIIFLTVVWNLRHSFVSLHCHVQARHLHCPHHDRVGSALENCFALYLLCRRCFEFCNAASERKNLLYMYIYGRRQVYMTQTIKRYLSSENKFSRKWLLKLTSRYWCSCELLWLETCNSGVFGVAD